MSEPLLPLIAKLVGGWFPELEGRSIAVSEADITRENMPKLPLAMTALIRSDGGVKPWNWKAANANQQMYDDFMVEFWLQPMKVRRADGTDSPFWAFYDYEKFRDRLLSEFTSFNGPRGQRIEFVNMTVESDQYAVVLSFRFRAHFSWCPIDTDDNPPIIGGDAKGAPSARIVQNLCAPQQDFCGPEFDQTEDCDPCSSQ